MRFNITSIIDIDIDLSKEDHDRIEELLGDIEELTQRHIEKQLTNQLKQRRWATLTSIIHESTDVEI